MTETPSPVARRLFYTGQKAIIERQLVELNIELARVTLALDQAQQELDTQTTQPTP